MSIDWIKAESDPSKSQKIEGRFLLDLRAKINDLEKQLTIKRDEVSKINSSLTDKDRDIKNLT